MLPLRVIQVTALRLKTWGKHVDYCNVSTGECGVILQGLCIPYRYTVLVMTLRKYAKTGISYHSAFSADTSVAAFNPTTQSYLIVLSILEGSTDSKVCLPFVAISYIATRTTWMGCRLSLRWCPITVLAFQEQQTIQFLNKLTGTHLCRLMRWCLISCEP